MLLDIDNQLMLSIVKEAGTTAYALYCIIYSLESQEPNDTSLLKISELLPLANRTRRQALGRLEELGYIHSYYKGKSKFYKLQHIVKRA